MPSKQRDSTTSVFEKLLDPITEASDPLSHDCRVPTGFLHEREYIYAPGQLPLPLFYGNGSLFQALLVKSKQGA